MMIQWIGCAALVLTLATPAWADAGQAEQATAAAPLFGTAASVANDELGAITGQADLNMQVRAQNTSTVSNNSVNGNSVTGAIGFDSSAFQNLSGLSVVSANTGNNVSINSSLNVNVALNP
jgi:hypothetical protein